MTTDKSPTLDPNRLQNIAATSPAIDTEVLLERCMGNVSFALTLLRELESNGEKQVEAVFQHAVHEDAKAAAEAAHSLKGAAAIIGAEPLRSVAAKIEAAGRECETSLPMDMVHNLRSEMGRCLDYLPIVRAELCNAAGPLCSGVAPRLRTESRSDSATICEKKQQLRHNQVDASQSVGERNWNR